MTSLNDGRSVSGVARRGASPTETIGTGGVAIYSGFITSNENDVRLTGTERYKTFSDILANVPIVAAGVRYFLNLVSKADWRAEPADDSAEAQEMADKVQDIMGDMETPWHRIVRRAAMYRFYGFSIQEWTAKRRDDGSIGMKDVEVRPQITIERWDTDETQKVIGVVQRSPQTSKELYLPRGKIVYIVDDSLSDSPEGLGLFRHIVDPARRLRRYQQLEGFGYEGDLRGIPIVRGPFTELAKLVKSDQITAAQKDELEQPLKDFVENHIKNPLLGLMLDSQVWSTTDERGTPSSQKQWDVELLDGGTYSLQEVAAAIERVMRDIARILGVEHLLLGADSAGSFAMSRDKSVSFGLVVDSTLRELRDQFQKDWLGPLFELNGWDPALKPKLKPEQIAFRNIEQIAEVIDRMATAGVILDREDEAVGELFDLLGLTRLMGQITVDPGMTLSTTPKPTTEPDETQP
jgi:hypothetical protein